MPDRTWKIAVGIALGTILLYLSPYVILGEDSYVLIEDHLDSSVVILKTLAESGLIFDTSGKSIPNYFNGIPRSNFHSEFSFLVWFYALFGAFSAMVINEVLIRLIGFFGMLWLLRRYFLPDPTQAAAVVGASLSFALLPHWPCGGLSVAGQPLLLAAFLSIRAGRYGWKEWAVVVLMPLYMGFVFSAAFFLGAVSLLWFLDLVRKKSWNPPFLLAIVASFSIHLAFLYRLIRTMFFGGGFVSHRTEMSFHMDGTLEAFLSRTLDNLLHGQMHAWTVAFPFLVMAFFLALGVSFTTASVDASERRTNVRLLSGGFLILLCTTFLYSFYYSAGMGQIKEWFPLFAYLNVSRFNTLQPLIWSVLFAFSLRIISRGLKGGRRIVILLLALQTAFLFHNSDFSREYRNSGIRYSEFFAEDLFEAVKTEIGRPVESYRVAALGFHPSVLQYNGFMTLDGYLVNYPLEYKHAFGRIIGRELKKNTYWRAIYANWGSRVYLYSAELNEKDLVTPHLRKVIRNLEIDTTAFYEMGGRFVLSAVPVLPHPGLGLTLRKVFKSPESAWDIYLYQVDRPGKEQAG